MAACTRLRLCLPGLQHGGLPPQGSRSTAAGLHLLAACLPARLPARAAPPCRTCAEPHPQARKDVPPAGLNRPGGLDQLAGVPRALAQLLPGSNWSQGRGGKRKGGEVSGTASLRAEQGGAAQPRTALSIIYHPHPSEAWSPLVLGAAQMRSPP